MAFHQEFDQLTWEARKNVASTFVFWPKVFGENVKAESRTSPNLAPTFTVHDRAGLQIASGEGSVNDVDDPIISYVLIQIPPIAELGEGYSVRITWSLEGEADSFTDTRVFDVVSYPFGDPSVTLNGLLAERPDIGLLLDRIGQRLDYTAGDEAKTRAAAVYAFRARVELDAKIRAAVSDAAQTRPRLILNRERLSPVERFLALKNIYVSEALDPEEGTDSSSALYRHYRDEAERAWKSIGPLQFDVDEDLVPDTEVKDLGRYIIHRRVR